MIVPHPRTQQPGVVRGALRAHASEVRSGGGGGGCSAPGEVLSLRARGARVAAQVLIVDSLESVDDITAIGEATLSGVRACVCIAETLIGAHVGSSGSIADIARRLLPSGTVIVDVLDRSSWKVYDGVWEGARTITGAAGVDLDEQERLVLDAGFAAAAARLPGVPEPILAAASASAKLVRARSCCCCCCCCCASRRPPTVVLIFPACARPPCRSVSVRAPVLLARTHEGHAGETSVCLGRGTKLYCTGVVSH